MTLADTQGEFTVFISYAHKDNEDSNLSKRWLDRLLEHLEPLVAQNKVSVWSDTQIESGQHWHETLQAQLQTAKVAVLLISPAFLASRYIRNSELPGLLLNAKHRGVIVLPIIVRHCLFSEAKFKYPDPVNGPEELSLSVFQAANSVERPLNAIEEHEQDQVLLSIARRILRISQQLPLGGPLDTNNEMMGQQKVLSQDQNAPIEETQIISTEQARSTDQTNQNKKRWRMRLSKVRIAIVVIIAALATIIVGYWQYPTDLQEPTKQEQYDGQVIDSKGTPIHGAVVRIKDEEGNVQEKKTDSEGKYQFSMKQSVKSVHFVVTADGYQIFERNLSLEQTEVEPFALKSVPPIPTPTPSPTPTLAPSPPRRKPCSAEDRLFGRC